jgi:hypothetical protein
MPIADELTGLHPSVVSALRAWEDGIREEITEVFSSSTEGLSEPLKAVVQPFFEALTEAIPARVIQSGAGFFQIVSDNLYARERSIPSPVTKTLQ